VIKEIDIHCIENDRYGFTLPYLYKIEKNNGREKSISKILELLSKENKEYIISYCDDLNELIIGLHKREYPPIHMYDNFGNLYYDQDVIGEKKSFQELVNFMSEKYQSQIDNKTYSKNMKTKKWE
jgi:fatty acid-binding protein DegV